MIEPKDIEPEITTVWSFPERGDWATHNPKYRGNFAPQIPRNIIMKFSKEGDTVLDPMVGGGTTLIETKLLNRKGVGVDINPDAVELTKKALEFKTDKNAKQTVKEGDARNLDWIEDDSVDLIVTHPPYLNIIRYTNGKIEGDLSNISGVDKFLGEVAKVASECLRVLKPDHYCAILMGDTRKSRHYVPLAFYVMQTFLKAGFVLKEDIIKLQHNCYSTPYWKNQVDKYNFYLILHEHLFVFRKPAIEEKLSKYRNSLFKNF